jgi:DNA polymerase III delta prime subunit
MSSSILIFGSNKKDRELELFKNISNIQSPDVLVIENIGDKKSIGIDQIREGIRFLQEKPFELKHKYVVIPKAERLTTEAQNSLLKVLEEPPIYAEIRLGTKSEQDLLETVISRCKRINLNIKKAPTSINSEKEKNKDAKENRVEESEKKDIKKEKKQKKLIERDETYSYKNFKNLNIGEKLDFIEDLGKEEKEDIIEILEQWILEEREFMRETKNTISIQTLLKITKDLENTNINTKLTLEYLAIQS